MKFLNAAAVACAAAATGAFARRSPAHVNKQWPERLRRDAPKVEARQTGYGSPPSSNGSYIIPQTANTTKFAVDGTAIPDVSFDIGESYAGLLPISDAKNASELYFWFFPSHNDKADDEILIWLNGGPGCSSLEGLLQENGPFLWQYGTFAPVKNNYAWNNLTNVVWVEQPVGTGFSQGKPTATNEEEAAAQFLGFWKNFIDTFGLHGRKVYIAGESYAGYYVPYIADAMFNKKDKHYYNAQSILIYDPSLSYDVLQQDIVSVPFVDYWGPLINLNSSFNEDIHNRAEACGYTSFIEDNWNFPPKGKLPTPPNADGSQDGCGLWNDIANAATLVNPCFDIYQVATTCPLLWDVLGFPGSFDYLPEGATIYFNRTDVQKAINAPVQEWEECSGGVLRRDTSAPSGLSVLPSVIERTKKTIIGHGMLDYILIANGSLLTIQNMTWNGAQGFSKGPDKFKDFFVPYHSELNQGDLAAGGVMGKYHTERGLTFVTVDVSGHMVPQYQPSAAYRQLEFLLGRIPALDTQTDFTTQTGDFGNGLKFTPANASMLNNMMMA